MSTTDLATCPTASPGTRAPGRCRRQRPTTASEVNPGAVAWFRASAERFLTPVTGYLAILDAHGLGYVEMRSDDPGRIAYEDDHQVVAVPQALQRMPRRPGTVVRAGGVDDV